MGREMSMKIWKWLAIVFFVIDVVYMHITLSRPNDPALLSAPGIGSLIGISVGDPRALVLLIAAIVLHLRDKKGRSLSRKTRFIPFKQNEHENDSADSARRKEIEMARSRT